MATDAEWAWVAGIIEGEGHLSLMFKPFTHLEIRVGMTDMDVVEKLQKYTGFGKIYINNRLPPRKTLFDWRVGKAKNTKYILENILPWLGERRGKKARDMLAVIQPDNADEDRQKLCLRVRELRNDGLSIREIMKYTNFTSFETVRKICLGQNPKPLRSYI